MADARKLPKKEHDLFKSIPKFYELKQYKKGVKAADLILKKFPQHGETLAMKGLVMNGLDRKEEAHELCRTALRLDMKSHVCWHVYGLLHRSDHNYLDAIKSYKQALRIEPDNMQILRDVSLLQIQMRDLTGFQTTRHKLLQLKPAMKLNWVAFAVANHLLQQHAQAVKIVDAYVGTLESRTADFEESELMLYKAQLLSEQGLYEEALAHLDECKELVLDKLGWFQERAALLLLTEDFAAAREAWRRLLVDYSPENYGVHRGWQCALLELPAAVSADMLKLKACDLPSTALQLPPAQAQLLAESYAALALELPRGRATQRIPLTFLQGEPLTEALTRYAHRAINRGVPALAADLSALYVEAVPPTVNGSAGQDHWTATALRLRRVKDPHAVAQNPFFLEALALADQTLDALQASGRFSGAAADEPLEPPTSLLWALFLKAQLEEARGDYEAALLLIDRCIEHTPTAVDMYERRARLLRKSGDVQGAADQMDAARRLDLADRYINNKCTKYLLRAGKMEQAMSTIALFTRHEGDPQHNLNEMQVMWVQTEYGRAALAADKYGIALKKFLAVEKHFTDFIDDQFDFHTYCLRKVTLRAYVSILRLTDNIQSHKFFARAALGAIETYLAVFDNPPKPSAPEEPDYSSMTPAQRKREKAKARKAAARKAAEEEQAELLRKQAEEEKKAQAAAEEEASGRKKKKPERVIPVDTDPHGDKLLEKDPLLEANRLVKVLSKFAPNELSTHTSNYDTQRRRGKHLLSLQALCRAARINDQAPEVFERLVDLAARATGGAEPLSMSEPARQAFDAELAALLGGRTLTEYVEAFAGHPDTSGSLARALAAGKALVRIDASAVARAADIIAENGLSRRGVSVAACAEAHAALLSFGPSAAAAAEQWHALCAARFPRSAAFGTPTGALPDDPGLADAPAAE